MGKSVHRYRIWRRLDGGGRSERDNASERVAVQKALDELQENSKRRDISPYQAAGLRH